MFYMVLSLLMLMKFIDFTQQKGQTYLHICHKNNNFNPIQDGGWGKKAPPLPVFPL